MFSIFLQSQIASHTAAGALLFNQLLLIGCPCEVEPDAMLESAISVLTDLSQIQVKCPFKYGVIDGLVMLLNQMLTQGEQMIADQFLETGLWDLLWQRIATFLKPENEENTDLNFDWTFMSPNGYLYLLQLSTRMLTMSSQNCIALILKDDNVMFDALGYILSDRFLASIKQNYDPKNDLESFNLHSRHGSIILSNRTHDDFDSSVSTISDINENYGDYLVGEFIINICQIICFPFAIDSSEEVLGRTYKIIKDYNLFNKIIQACIKNYKCNKIKMDIPMGLITRLILTDDDLVQLMVNQMLNSSELADFFATLLYSKNSSESLIGDMYTIFSHLSRKSEDIVGCLIKILNGQENFKILIKSLNGNLVVKSKCCNMIGNMMKFNDLFYDILKKERQIFDCLIKCCQLEEINVRKSACYALGNSVYHSDLLYPNLEDKLAVLIKLLSDSLAKTRIHSTGKIFNFFYLKILNVLFGLTTIFFYLF